MNRTRFRFASMIVACSLLGACASLSTNVFRFEQLTSKSTKTAVQEYAILYKEQTNGASAKEIAQLNDERDQVIAASKEAGNALRVLEDWRINFTTNSASQPQLQAAWNAAIGESSNLVWLVNYLRTKPRASVVTVTVTNHVYVLSNGPPPSAEAPAK